MLHRFVRFVPDKVAASRSPSWKVASTGIVAISFLLWAAAVQASDFQGEIFQENDPAYGSVLCVPDGTGGGTLYFSIDGAGGPGGDAIGPHPADYILEGGKITFDSSGRLLGAAIGFTDENTFSGEKSLIEGTGGCTVDEFGNVTFDVSATLQYYVDFYSDGTRDEGTATLALTGTGTKRGLTSLNFTEVFTSSSFLPDTLGKATAGGNIRRTDDGKGGVTFGFNAQNTEQGK